MQRILFVLSLSLIGVLTLVHTSLAADTDASVAVKPNPASPLNHEMKTLDGKEVNPAKKYAGKVVLLVNVASKCGLTKQYSALQALHDKYADEGLAVVGVPCNQFLGQEPGSAEEIATFCSTNYGVEFDLLEKVEVNGPNASPIYKQLTSEETNPKSPGPISWNFEKFLFNRNGELVTRYSPRTTPDSNEVIAAIKTELAKQ